MRLLIVTGMSGAGKSKAMHALEDIGWFCVDNLPPALAPTFVQLLQSAAEPHPHAAVVMDVRAGGAFEDVFAALDALQAADPQMLFLDAADETLVARFKETRRQHPLCAQNPALGLAQAVAAERAMLGRLRSRAGVLIDTTQLSPALLRTRVVELFSENARQTMQVHLSSFGFKHGTPRDCDLLFDVRCLPNPFYVPDLKEHTGREGCVRDYVLGFAEARALLQKITELLLFTLPLYQKEGKSSLNIAFGCTGGKHRSVLFAEEAGSILTRAGYAVHIEHVHCNRFGTAA